MSQNIQAIYENGILRHLQPLDLPENKTVNITVLADAPNGEETHGDKVSRVLREAGLTSQMKFPNTKNSPTKKEKDWANFFPARNLWANT